MLLAATRAIERLLIASGGIFTIYLGFKLFLLGIESVQKLAVETGEVKLRLLKVAPGTAFAIFGAALLIFCVIRPLSFVPSPRADGTTESSQGFSYAGSPLGCAKHFPPSRVTSAISDIEQEKPSQGDALVFLSQWRDCMVSEQVGEESLAAYKRIRASQTTASPPLDPASQKTFAVVSPWFDSFTSR